MKNICVYIILVLMSIFLCAKKSLSQEFPIKIQVVAQATGKGIENATIYIDNKFIAVTDSVGLFILSEKNFSYGELKITALGFKPFSMNISFDSIYSGLVLKLEESTIEINEILISNGYFQTNKRDFIGSYSLINQQDLKRVSGNNLIEKLIGVSPSIYFDKRNVEPEIGRGSTSILLRGESTFFNNTNPLIVINGFPYDGDPSLINPDDIESITLLKDASAASIWGARSGNGVILIELKNGNNNNKILFSLKLENKITNKPDLFSNGDFMDSENYMDLEKYFFEKGFYLNKENSIQKPYLSKYLEMLIKYRNGQINDLELMNIEKNLSNIDSRKDYSKYLYSNLISQNGYLSVNGGVKKMNFFNSLSFSNSKGNLIGNKDNGFSFNSTLQYNTEHNLKVGSGINISSIKSIQNGIGISNFITIPYEELKDNSNNFIPVGKEFSIRYIDEIKGVVPKDWNYYPILERELQNKSSNKNDFKYWVYINSRLFKNINVEGRYQFNTSHNDRNDFYYSDSYYVRNLVNKYFQSDGEYVFPEGDVVSYNYVRSTDQTGRIQLDYQIKNDKSTFKFISGGEIRQYILKANGYEVFGYDRNSLIFNSNLNYQRRIPVRPNGNGLLPSPFKAFSHIVNNYLSYYGNASYSFNNDHFLNGSLRWDGSNLFGVNTNQKGVPLWSLGYSYNLQKLIDFNKKYFDSIKLRATYGYSGNVGLNESALPIVTYSQDRMTNLISALIRTPGNSELRWEKIRVQNFGLDFKLKSNTNFSLEYFTKHSKDLLGIPEIDPTTGINSNNLTTNFKLNYAELYNYGLDLNVNSILLENPTKWKVNFLFSYIKNKILYYKDASGQMPDFRGLSNPMISGYPTSPLFSYKWYGLNQNGDPYVIIDGEKSNDYSKYIRGITLEELIYHGQSTPKFHGSLHNDFSYKNFHFGFSIIYKLGHYYRSQGLSYSKFVNNGIGHSEFINRWKNIGDESRTNIPSIPNIIDQNRDLIYLNSEIKVHSASNIKLYSLYLQYFFNNKKTFNSKYSIRLVSNNLGIIWKASNVKGDPDYPIAIYSPEHRSISIAFNLDF